MHTVLFIVWVDELCVQANREATNNPVNPTCKNRHKEIVARQELGLFILSGPISNDRLFIPGYPAMQSKRLHSQQPICL